MVFAGTDCVHRDAVRRQVGEPDRDEILQRIVVELGLHERVDGERAVRAGEQRVAVGRRARRHLGAEAAARAGAVLDHEGLAERLAHALAAQPRDEVRIAAGRERHDHAHRLVRIGGVGGARQSGCERRGRDGGQAVCGVKSSVSLRSCGYRPARRSQRGRRRKASQNPKPAHDVEQCRQRGRHIGEGGGLQHAARGRKIAGREIAAAREHRQRLAEARIELDRQRRDVHRRRGCQQRDAGGELQDAAAPATSPAMKTIGASSRIALAMRSTQMSLLTSSKRRAKAGSPRACCTACETSCAATATAAIERPSWCCGSSRTARASGS